ncbi:MAG: amino acid adenylation domain-containing protein [Clostridia bacterium]|nr:amino acid adenylation domain-containing protein [Clostridia bacterium]
MNMQTNLLEYLDATVLRVPDKLAFSDGETSLTFSELDSISRSIGSRLASDGIYGKPVVVFMDKSPRAVASFFGVLRGGCYYVPLDSEMPSHRIELILKSLGAGAAICDASGAETLRTFGFDAPVYSFDDIRNFEIDGDALASIRDRAIDTDAAYIVFTSGSTGIPKGVCACHRSVIDYIEHLSEVLEVSEDTVFGNQTPLYFDACLKELYPTLKFGATTYLIPKTLFMMPIPLVEFLNKYKINTVCWVVSALTLISSLGALDKVVPEHLHTVAFGSEVFPIKQFNRWREALPDAQFINLYGPTEATGMSCFYKVDRDFVEGEAIPIGRPFPNTGIILLDDEGKPANEGELLIRGTPVTLGYYNDPERTAEAFVQNPLNPHYPELVYKTGDIIKYNDRGELVFVSRKDHQIKHMGHRIELGEIELIANTCEGVSSACCIFDSEKKKLVLYYVGTVPSGDVVAFIREKLPRYMAPNKVIALDTMPLTANGKIDRKLIMQNYLGGK